LFADLPEDELAAVAGVASEVEIDPLIRSPAALKQQRAAARVATAI
jgi:hypothetical protein